MEEILSPMYIKRILFSNSFALCCAMLLVIGCTETKVAPKESQSRSSEEPSVTKAEGKKSQIGSFFRNPFRDEQIQKPPFQLNSLESLEQYAGKTIQIENRKIENRYDSSVIDEQVFVDGEYYSVYFYHVTKEGKFNLNYVRVTTDKYPLKYGVLMGQSRNSIVDVFGPEDGRNDHGDSYETYYFSGDEGKVNFSFKAEKLDAVTLWNAGE